MIRLRTLLAVFTLALPASLALAACGDDESSDEDPQTVLEETFENEETASSGNLNMSASLSAEGEEGGSFEGSLEGPFQGDPDDPAALPQLDLTGSASGESAGESLDFEAGLVITEDNAYVEYAGDTYEIGEQDFNQLRDELEAQADTGGGGASAASFREQCELAIEQAGGNAAACDIDLTTWLTNLTNEGTEDVGGTETIHISGDANVDQILSDFGEIAGSIPDAAAQGFDPSQLEAFSGVVSEASIDVYSGSDDRILRKLEADLVMDPSALGPVPVADVEVSFSVEIADLNEEQTIEAPSGDIKPIEDLTGGIPLDLGGLEGLGAGGGGADPDAVQKCVEQAQGVEEVNKCLQQSL